MHIFTCPVCGEGLIPITKADTLLPTVETLSSKRPSLLRCQLGHSFDIAREGYVNLLLKHLPGDTKEMLQARRNFLERGYYAPLSQSINQTIYHYLLQQTKQEGSIILDAGCGEGYYLGNLHQFLASQERGGGYEYLGIDISKDAIRMAARRYKDLHFVVANLKERLILADHTVQVLLNIFAPRNPQEFARVLIPGGLLFIIIPSPDHLLALRTTLHLLTIEENKQQHVIEQFNSSFRLIETTTIEYEVELNKEEIIQIVNMTPNHWHISQQTREAMQMVEHIQTKVGFICLSLLLA